MRAILSSAEIPLRHAGRQQNRGKKTPTAQDRRIAADNEVENEKAIGTEMDIGAVADISKAIMTPAPAPGPVSSGSQLAALKARLKVLFKTIQSVSRDGSLDAKSRKIMLQSLQAEIQMVMQRIAELENATKKKTSSPIDIVMELAAEDKDGLPHANKTAKDPASNDALPAFLQGKRIDITA